MAIAGIISLMVAFVAIVISVGAFLIEKIIRGSAKTVNKKSKEQHDLLVGRISLVGYIGVLITALALTFGCALLVYCFVAPDFTLEYVIRQHSDSSSPIALLYRVAGLWGGRAGSLLLWAWLIALFSGIIALKNLRQRDAIDSMALLVMQIVTFAFVVVLLFSESNMPFVASDPRYLISPSQLKSFEQLMQEAAAAGTGALQPSMVLGMNVLLEHWAMAIHPPTLFIGYAGLTVPFAYAIAALIVNDSSKKWVERSQRYALLSWVLLGIGIGLGAIWAYVVLGWGGYWGWDPVENASLLSWLLAVALVHSFTVYRQRGGFKRWSVMCACLAFAFVIVGTFITRSGIVQSVHAFEGDPVSLFLFLGLIVLSVLVGVIGLLIRGKNFGSQEGGDELGESLATRDVAYYFNNLVLVLSALLVLYLTLSSAFPSWMPYGGMSLSASTYHAIARPLGILYCLLMAVCPLLSWAKTDGKLFWKRIRIPALCSLFIFALLLVYFIVYLMPSYNAMIAAGGSQATTMLEGGPSFYYFFLTLAGFFVASLLLMNSLFMLGRIIGGQAKAKRINPVVACFSAMVNQPSRFGGFLAHFSMAIILVGLIGSSMYVTSFSGYLPYDEETDTAGGDFIVQNYRLVYDKNSVEPQENGSDIIYSVTFDVYKGDQYRGKVSPGIFFVQTNQQRKPLAGVMSSPLEDLFIVYNGMSSMGGFSLSVFINPLISFVWVGFGLLMVGTIISTVGRRGPRAKVKASSAASASDDDVPLPVAAWPEEGAEEDRQ
ncbi:MAG: cytochrome c biogenesis protein CcsA [Coriobacteriales bacterium]|jgi:cytochrome c-type biogenesis protein CcmF|nr:cytochrome c biogenesis protein CcsA [Coriobacteriales bacterium]